MITDVAPDSPAERAGIRPGDRWWPLDGKPIDDAQDLRNAQGLKPLGSTLALDIVRDGKHAQVSAKLAADAGTLSGDALDPRLSGASFVDLPDNVRAQGINGVGISDVQDDSRAAAQGLAPGDIVLRVNNRATPTLAALRQALSARPRQLLVTIARDGQLAQLMLQ